MKYIFTIEHVNDNMEVNETFTDWITANSINDAKQQIEKVYPYKLGYKCTFLNETN